VPPLAAVGLTEAEARARGHAVTVADHDLATWKVYAIAGAPAARARVILDTRTGRILGAHLFGPEASETVMLFAFAIRFGITADELRRTVFAYPTLASALPHTLP